MAPPTQQAHSLMGATGQPRPRLHLSEPTVSCLMLTACKTAVESSQNTSRSDGDYDDYTLG